MDYLAAAFDLRDESRHFALAAILEQRLQLAEHGVDLDNAGAGALPCGDVGVDDEAEGFFQHRGGEQLGHGAGHRASRPFFAVNVQFFDVPGSSSVGVLQGQRLP